MGRRSWLLRVALGFTVVVSFDTMLLLTTQETDSPSSPRVESLRRLRPPSSPSPPPPSDQDDDGDEVGDDDLLSKLLNTTSSPSDDSLLRLAFRRTISVDEKRALLKLVRLVADEFRRANVTYFLYGGSLLGSYRHHGMIPWDDDVDLVVDTSQRERVELALRSVPDHVLYAPHRRAPRYKFYWRYSRRVDSFRWRWPYVDLSFFVDNGTHVSDADPIFADYTYRRDDVFPTSVGPFEGSTLPVPRRTLACLSTTYNVSACKTLAYSHRREKGIARRRRYAVPCEALRGVYPFAHVNTSSSPPKSVLMLGATIVGEFVLPPGAEGH